MKMNELEAKQFFLNATQEVLDKTAKKIARSLAVKLASRPESEYYFRTGELVSALENPPKAYYSGSNLVCNIVDEKKIHQIIVKTARRFNEHMSLKGQKSYNNLSIKYHTLINQNYGYSVPTGKKIPGLHYIEGALGTDNIEHYVNTELQKTIKIYAQNLMKKGVK